MEYKCPACKNSTEPVWAPNLNWACNVCGYVGNVGNWTKIAKQGRLEVLVEREATHGDFKRVSKIAQSLKDIYKEYKYDMLPEPMCESLDLIATKIARILAGNAKTKDHWDDIAGYAKLGSEACGDD